MTWLRVCWEFLESISPTFWGVVFGSLVSLGGVALTNRASDRRLRIQLETDRQLRAQERELGLRREIYLAAAEALQGAFSTINLLPNLDIPQDKISGSYDEKGAAIGKVKIIATEKTIQTVVALASALTGSILQLTAKRIPLLRLKQQMTNLTGLIAGFSKSREQILELMKQYNIDGLNDPQRFKTLQSNFDFEQKRIMEATGQFSKMERELAEKLLALSEECAAVSQTLGELVIPVVVAVREELGVPIDPVAYGELLKASREHTKQRVTQFLAEMRQIIATPPPS
jgi:hypothetical protein